MSDFEKWFSEKSKELASGSIYYTADLCLLAKEAFNEGYWSRNKSELEEATSVILAAMCANPALVEVGYSEKVKQAKMQAMVLLKELEK